MAMAASGSEYSKYMALCNSESVDWQNTINGKTTNKRLARALIEV